ncbi:helix-turn-helix transcriptional regulator [Jongsikchunia kroppenstedtii]|uniref:helix-turn-helix transcriptional regulator n=1 Tax=Jongsikchunia kroppenstedtii TaxID=1121721 RepID=UPI00037122B2|nr:metalloregulator ArsR/SmtB family transcription factor [Jongsikchunia kroppenstedtii]
MENATAAHAAVRTDGHTRASVVEYILERGPITAGEIGDQLGISAAGVRRHLDALIVSGDVEVAPAPKLADRGRGRPAKRYQLTPSGRGQLRHGYDDLAVAVMRRLRDVGGESAVEDFARDRVAAMVGDIDRGDNAERTVEQIADALTAAGFSATTRRVGAGVQICQHHCPVAHVAAEFPELCEAETAMFAEVLGTHVQRLATIANGDCACTTHVPIVDVDNVKTVGAQPAPMADSKQEEER